MEDVCNQIEAQGIALVGNPGAGKSTILNGIAGQAVFRAGISLGTGLTSVLKTHHIKVEKGTLTLFDTPGLADMEKKVQAGEEIDKVLQTNFSIKLAFVVTLEQGRVKPDDATTVKLVLQAIKSVDVKNRFGVIINQVSPAVLKQLKEDPEKAAKVRSGITDAFPTSHWIYLPRISDLEDATDGKLMTGELVTFFAGLPTTKPPDAEVEKIDTSNMEQKIQEQQKRIVELQSVNEAQREEMLKQLKQHKVEAEQREKEIKERLSYLQIQLERALDEAEQEKHHYKRLRNNISNGLKLVTGAAASALVLNPAPLIIAASMCKSVPKPKQKERAQSK